MVGSRRERRSYRPEVQEELRLREELKKAALPTAAYIRRSVIDVEEASIENQIAIVHSYIRENPELTLVDTYVDNGTSGTTFDRVDWKRMMRDVQCGRISCIVVKDLSRFARDYIEAGMYIEDVFPKLNVRFIAITDNYDNTAGDTIEASMMVPAKNILNDLYARDASRKRRLVNERMREEGRPNPSSAPLGYFLEDGKIMPDPDLSPVIRMMFQWADLGVPIVEIAERLQFLGVETKQKCDWDQSQVRFMLKNEVYIGTLTLGKCARRNGHRVYMPKEKWTVYPDNHEPLVDKELFNRVNERIKPKAKRSDSGKTDWKGDSPWNGMVYCAVCGMSMRKECRCDAFMCPRHTLTGSKKEPLERAPKIGMEELDALVYRRCRKRRKELDEIMPLIQTANRKGGIMEELTRKAVSVLAEKKKEQDNLERVYDDYCDGLMDEADYMELSERYEKRLRLKRNALNEILSEQRKLKAAMAEVEELIKDLEGVARMTPEKVREFVERIEVRNEFTVNVIVRHQDSIDLLMTYVKARGRKGTDK